ncbi:MAG: NifB/NifX family molybdenum-iron cluster-binding protein [Verrucomicrobiota bacterium JB025]|nr:NifB/NifX family molybdenum-iron cluster-binding protein [Verrucomicrobiota bacterium JB025]
MIDPVAAPPSILRIAIPMKNGAYCRRFREADAFAVFEGVPGSEKITKRPVVPVPRSGEESHPDVLIRHGIGAVVSSVIGDREVQVLTDAGVSVMQGIGIHQPAALALFCLSGDLPRVKARSLDYA